MRLPLLPYPYYLLRELTDVAPEQQVVDRLRRGFLRANTKTFERVLKRKGATHREHNINTNFDGIEISGSYDQATRTVINIVAQGALRRGLIEPRGQLLVSHPFFASPIQQIDSSPFSKSRTESTG